MRSGFRLLVGGLLLGAGLLAGGHVASAQQVAGFLAAFGPQACETETPRLQHHGLPPGAFPATGLTCGSCSDAYCKGATYNQVCFNGVYGQCLDPEGDEMCSDGVTHRCQCWHGPLP